MADKNMAIGVAGGTGSGKTTLVNALARKFGQQLTILSHDNYYRAHHELSYEQRCRLNYDHPDAFETDLMIDHLRQLKQGKDIHSPTYDYTIHNRAAATLLVPAKPVILVEGILIYTCPKLCQELDIKLFVDTDADVRLCRRILRDVQERERTVDSVIQQYLTTVKPMHEQFVAPSRKYADIIVPEGGHNLVALEMIVERIRTHLNGRPS